MNKRRLLSLAGLMILLGTFGISRSLAYIDATIATYQHAAPCGKLSGFAGLLQATHFIPSGNCAVNTSGGCANPGGQCTSGIPLSGKAPNGTCQGSTNSCSCVVNPT